MDEREKLVTDSLQKNNIFRCDVRNIIWSFSMPLWCNKHLPLQTSIYCFEILGCLSIRAPETRWRSQQASPQIWGGQIFDFKRGTVFCFRHRLSKHKLTRNARNLGRIALLPTPMRVPQTLFPGGELCFFRPSSYFLWSNGLITTAVALNRCHWFAGIFVNKFRRFA